TASVRVRTEMPMETRTAFGKVWADLDGDGKQSAGEPGIEGVDVWTDDGDVATTDRDGRYSFHNLRPGRHSFRVDRASLPTGFGFGAGAAERAQDVAVRDASGWTTPRIDFRLVASGGRLVGARAVKPGEIATAYACPRVGRMDGITQQGAPVSRDSSGAADTDRPECVPVDSSCALCLPIDSASARLVAQRVDPHAKAEEFPDVSKLPAGAEMDVVFQPPFTGWPSEGTVILPNGWEPVAQSSFFGATRIAEPSVGRDRTGARTLRWEGIPKAFGLVSVRLRSLRAARPADSARIAALRTADERSAEKRLSLTQGAGIEIFAPRDGVVMASDHVYVGVRGEPG